jgi:hypothetical protein
VWTVAAAMVMPRLNTSHCGVKPVTLASGARDRDASGSEGGTHGPLSALWRCTEGLVGSTHALHMTRRGCDSESVRESEGRRSVCGKGGGGP